MNCTCWVKYAKWRIRWVILSLIDVDKWLAYVDDLIEIEYACYAMLVLCMEWGMDMYMWYAWILECLCLFMLIMIHVKLTLSGLGPPTCLYEWVDDVQE